MSSIQRTLAVVLVVGFGLLLGAGGWLIHYLVSDALLERYDAKLRVEALTIITATEQEREGVDVEFTDRYIREFDDEVGTQFFQVWHPNGKTIERSDSLKRSHLPTPEKFGSLDQPFYYDLELPDGREARAVSLRFVPHAGSREQRYYDPGLKVGLVVAALRGELDQTLASLRMQLAGVGIAAVAGALALVLFALRQGMAPLREVASRANGIDASTLQTRFPVTRLPAELQPICRQLNDLLARLEASFERERRFSADVAHELRTPIAELRSLSEVALKWPPNAAESHESFGETLAIARRMESLVAALQTIGRSESGETRVQAVPIRLSAFLTALWESHAEAARARKLTVAFDLPPAQRIVSDPVLLESVFTNLLANAVEYTPAGGRIRVSGTTAPDRSVSVTVSNDTEGLSAREVAQMFDRFWRKDTSRTDERHSGLGLSLVRAVAQTLGTQVTAELVEVSTLVIRVHGLAAGIAEEEVFAIR